MINKINIKLHTPTWLFVLMLVVLLLRIPSFFEPYSYGDEMIYLALGEGVRQGVPLYSGVHDNKPPLLYLAAALSGSLFWFRVLLALWHFVTIFLFWKLSETLFPKNKKVQIVSTTIFALGTALPLLEGNIANAEMFMIGTTIAAFWLLLSRKLTPALLISAGMLLSISTLFKMPALFDIAAIVFLWLATMKLTAKNTKKILVNTVYLGIGVAIPVALTFVWYWAQGAFLEYFIAAYGQNVGYLSSFRPGDIQEPFLVKNGPLLSRGGLVFAGLLILFALRKKLSRQFLFITAWLVLGLFAVALSERPYPHYMVQVAPAIALLLGMLVGSKTKEQVYTIVPLAIAFYVPVYFNFWHYPTLPYYTRFAKLATGQIDRDQYMDTFGGHIRRNYEIAEYIQRNTEKTDKVFVSGDSSMIYALSRRLPPIKYVADYHIRDFSSTEEVLAQLQKSKPALIIVLPDSDMAGELQPLLNNNYRFGMEIDGAKIYKLLGSDLRALIAP